MYIYLLTYCELKLLHDHSNILHNAHYACLTSTTSLPCGIQAGHSRVQLQGSTRSRTALYLSNDSLLVAEIGRRLRSADARTYVSYRGPGPSLITGALLWLDRGLGFIQGHWKWHHLIDRV